MDLDLDAPEPVIPVGSVCDYGNNVTGGRSEMSVAHERHDDGGAAEVTEMSRAEYRAARKKALKSVGLTYDQLAEQARRREFSSPRAQKLWVAIGGEAG